MLIATHTDYADDDSPESRGGETPRGTLSSHPGDTIVQRHTQDYWIISSDRLTRVHVDQRLNLYCPTENDLPIPIRYIDVTRKTITNLDNDKENEIEDIWTELDSQRSLSDEWTGRTVFEILKPEPPEGYTWSSGRLTKKQQTERPENIWPELWHNMSKSIRRFGVT